jgi:hypothetical protein
MNTIETLLASILPAEKDQAIDCAEAYTICKDASSKEEVSSILSRLYRLGIAKRIDLGSSQKPRFKYYRAQPEEIAADTVKNMAQQAVAEIETEAQDQSNSGCEADKKAIFDIPAFLRKQPEPETITNTLTQALITVAASLPADGAIIIEIESPGISIRLELDNGDSVFYLGSDFSSVRKILDAYQTLQQYKE